MSDGLVQWSFTNMVSSSFDMTFITGCFDGIHEIFKNI